MIVWSQPESEFPDDAKDKPFGGSARNLPGIYAAPSAGGETERSLGRCGDLRMTEREGRD